MRITHAAAAVVALSLAAVAPAQPTAPATLSACALGGLMQREVAMRRGMAPPADSSLERRLAEMAAADLDRTLITRRRMTNDGPSVRIRLGQTPGWIGVQLSEVSNVRETPDGRSVLYCDYPVVVSVEPDSPAQRGGLEAGDTIVAYNGRDLRAGDEIPLDQLLVPNDTLRVTVRRDGRPMQLALVVARRPEVATMWGATSAGQRFSYVLVSPDVRSRSAAPSSMAAAASTGPPAARSSARVSVSPMLLTFGFGGSALAGAQLVAVDDDLGAVIGTRTGVLVLKVADGTPASAAGLRAGDVITLAAGRAVATPAMLQQTLVRRIEERALALRVVRKGKARDVTLKW